eukprot:8856002-Ditylum_brightwellii.AAC.1
MMVARNLLGMNHTKSCHGSLIRREEEDNPELQHENVANTNIDSPKNKLAKMMQKVVNSELPSEDP